MECLIKPWGDRVGRTTLMWSLPCRTLGGESAPPVQEMTAAVAAAVEETRPALAGEAEPKTASASNSNRNSSTTPPPLQFCVRVGTQVRLPVVDVTQQQAADLAPMMHDFAGAFFNDAPFTTQWVVHHQPLIVGHDDLPESCLEVWFDTASMRLAVQFIQLGVQ
jgi:hypothetical protein